MMGRGSSDQENAMRWSILPFMKIHCLGAAGEVTGSCFLVELAGRRVLVDCGLYFGMEVCSRKNAEPFGFDASTVDAVCVTHAHLDHIGRLPRLVDEGFEGEIFTTAATADLSALNLDDAEHAMTEEMERCKSERLYTEQAVDEVKRRWHVVSWRQPITIAPDVVATFGNTGHILGSSFVVLEAEGKRVCFSGDVGNVDVPILPALDPLPRDLDLLVTESTYGGKRHEPRATRLSRLEEVVRRTIEEGGVLMIPAFSLERTQELLFDLNRLVEHQHLALGTVYMDGPLGIEVTDVYRRHAEDLDIKLPPGFKDHDVFSFPGLVRTQRVEESKAINTAPLPKIIIAGAGMMNAGRIQHHLLRYASSSKNTLLIIGYQGVGTLGRAIQDGVTPVEIRGERVDIACRIEKIDSYSAHADEEVLTTWIVPAHPRRIALVHGEDAARQSLHMRLEKEGLTGMVQPQPGDVLEV